MAFSMVQNPCCVTDCNFTPPASFSHTRFTDIHTAVVETDFVAWQIAALLAVPAQGVAPPCGIS